MSNFSGAGRRPGIAGLGNTPPVGVVSIPGERLGPDRSRAPYEDDSRFWISSTTWAQRAINAWRRAAPNRGSLVEVDGIAGPITMAALRQIDPNASNYPFGGDNTRSVLITKTVADQLAALAPVADPPRSSTPSANTDPIDLTEPELEAPAALPATRSVYSTWLKAAFALGMLAVLGAGVYWYWQTKARSGAKRKSFSFRGFGDSESVVKPIPAKGDPRGHIAASTSSLRGLRRGKSRRRPTPRTEA